MSILLSQNKTYSKSSSPHVDYPDTDGVELTDGTISTGGTYGGSPGSLYASALDVTIDLGQICILDYARFHYFTWYAGSAEAPTQVVMSGSGDGVSFTTIATYTQAGGYWTNGDGDKKYSNNLTLNNSQYRYIKFSFTKTAAYMCFSEMEIYGILAGGQVIIWESA